MATKRTKEILALLDEHYTREYKCYLNHENPGQLLIATILSAQCTDARVNVVTKDLFQKYPSMEAFANADLNELEQDIKPTGFYHNKAKNILGCARKIMDTYHGEVPSRLEDLITLPGVGRKTANVIRGNIFHEPSIVVDTYHGEVPSRLEDLITLPGVGRKTANVIRGNIFHEPSIVVDTHVKRISRRLRLTKEEDPVKIEMDLMKVLPKDHWILYNIQIITFGRQICFARGPKCEECFLTKYCKERRK